MKNYPAELFNEIHFCVGVEANRLNMVCLDRSDMMGSYYTTVFILQGQGFHYIIVICLVLV